MSKTMINPQAIPSYNLLTVGDYNEETIANTKKLIEMGEEAHKYMGHIHNKDGIFGFYYVVNFVGSEHVDVRCVDKDNYFTGVRLHKDGTTQVTYKYHMDSFVEYLLVGGVIEDRAQFYKRLVELIDE